jgi:hypothetical protein
MGPRENQMDVLKTELAIWKMGYGTLCDVE